MYQAFEVYRGMAPPRTITAAYKHWAGIKKGRKGEVKLTSSVSSTFSEWSRFHDWLERAAAWDAHLKRLEDAEAERSAVENIKIWERRKQEIRETGFGWFQELRESVKQMLAHPLTIDREEEVEETEDGTIIKQITRMPARWDRNTIVKFIEAADKVGRLAACMETDRGFVPYDLSNLSDEQLRQLGASMGGPGRDTEAGGENS